MRRVALFAALMMSLIIALVTACGGISGSGGTAALPQGATVLADAAKAMRTVTSTHFAVEVQGDAREIQLRSANGQITREGSAKGIANVDFGRQLLELQFVIIGDQLYLNGFPGGIQKMPASNLSAYFDPRPIFDPDRGIASVLASGQEATTEAREPIDGVDSYRLQVTFPAQPLTKLAPGLGLVPDKPSEIWVAVQGSRLIKVQFPTTTGSVTAHFSEYDAPVQITPPA